MDLLAAYLCSIEADLADPALPPADLPVLRDYVCGIALTLPEDGPS